MIYVQHFTSAPRKLNNKFTTFTPLNAPEARSSWKSFTGKQELTKNMNFIQKGLCAYCEVKLNAGLGSHIEHIQPKSVYHNLTFQYTNLILSCFSSENISKNDPSLSCGHYKKNNYDSVLFIAPTDSNCNNNFICNPLGEIKPHYSLNQAQANKAIYSINLLNLNSNRLVRHRANIIEEGLKIISELEHDPIALAYFINLEFSIINNTYAFPFINLRKEYFNGFI